MNRKKLIITGASGFLGSHLLDRLKNENAYTIYALSSKPDKIREKIGGETIIYRHKDELIPEMLKDSIIINCAYPRNSAGMEIADGLKYIQGLFESAVEYKSSAIINISSQSVYSQKRTEAATEETPVCLESPYAVGKYAVELMLQSICKGTNTISTNLRMASLIGPGFDQRIVNRFVKKLLIGERITVMRQAKRMGFLDVEDAVSAILSVVKVPVSTWKSVYNVGNNIGYTIEEIYDAVVLELGSLMEISLPIFENGTDTSSSEVSYASLNRDTGFIPVIDLHESVRRIVAQI